MITFDYLGVAIVAIVLVLSFYFVRKWPGNPPPGPHGLPFFGSAFDLDPAAPHRTLTEWTEKYGDIYRIKMFGADYVLLSDYDSIYEALVLKSKEFGGRPPMFRMKAIMQFRGSLVLESFSKKFVFMKKVAMQTLKMYGDRLKTLEKISQDIIDDTLTELEAVAQSGEPIDLKPVLFKSIASIMESLVHGKKPDDSVLEKAAKYEDDFNEHTAQAGVGVVLDIFPWMRYFPLRSYYQKILKCGKDAMEDLKNQISETKSRYVPGHPVCFLDGLFEHQRTSQQGNDEFVLSDDDVHNLAKDVISGGRATTIVTILAMIAVLVNHPKIQTKVSDEIRTHVGDRRPLLIDGANLHYTRAMIYELFRYHTLVPLGFIHKAMVDTKIAGYDIPRNTAVFFNMWKLNHNLKFWDAPWEFRPERFLDENGKLVTADHLHRKRLLPFGAGRRVCPGEVLAKNRLFLIITSLLQHFEILPESEEKKPSSDPHTYVSGLNLQVKPYKVILKHRK